MTRTSTPTTLPRMIGPQFREPATLTGVTGLRPLFLAPGVLPPPLFAAADLAPPAGGLPWPDVLPTLTVDGTRSGPGVLMLIVPRQFVRMREGGARVAAECRSLPPIAWLGDSRRPCRSRSLRCSCRLRVPWPRS